MPQITIKLRLGRISMAHTAVPGVHLHQDESTRTWQTGTHAPKLSFVQKVLLELKHYKPSKWSAALAACISGVAMAVLFNHLPSGGLLNKNPQVPLQSNLSPPHTASIEVAQAAYTALPPPLNDVPLPALLAPPFDVTSEPLPPAASGNTRNVRNASNLPAAARALKQAARTPRDDAPMAVFNESVPLEPVQVNPAKPVVLKGSANALLTQPPVSNGPVVLKSREAQNPLQSSIKDIDSNAESTRASGSQQARILAVPTSESIVVTNPSNRLPMMVKVGEQLPDGSVLKSVDKATSSAQTSRGQTLSLR